MIKYPNSPLIKRCVCGNRPFIDIESFKIINIYCSKPIPSSLKHIRHSESRKSIVLPRQSINSVLLRVISEWNNNVNM